MADFEYAFASAGTPTSFTIPNTGITGIDEAGTLTPKAILLGDNVTVLITATKTQAEIAALMLSYLRPRGYAQDGPGSPNALAYDGQLTLAETNVAAAD